MTIPSFPVVFCKDCRWSEASGAVCARPRPEQYNLVTGEKSLRRPGSPPALRERKSGLCGPAGSLYEPST